MLKVGMKKTGLILDSNYFLHYHLPEAINWTDIINDDGEIILLVIPPVAAEIDKKKWAGKNESERQRAKDITSTFKAWFHNEQLPNLPNGIHIEKVKYDPSISSNSTKSPDDQILDYALALRSSFSEIAILTHDFGLQDRARDLRLPYFELPNKFQRKTEIDPVKKELLETQKELNKFKIRLPKIQINFVDADIPIQFQDESYIAMADDHLKNELEKIKLQTPLYVHKGQNSSKEISINGKSLYEIEMERWNRYNSDLEEYYTDYKKYLHDLDKHKELLSRTIALEISVENRGNTPASDLFIKLHFPITQDAMLLEEDIFPTLPQEPTPPVRPKHRGLFTGFGEDWKLSTHLSNLRHDIQQPPNISKLSFKDNVGVDVNFTIRSLKHHSKEHIEKIYLILPTRNTRSFQISWEAISDEMPAHDSGTLPVIIPEHP